MKTSKALNALVSLSYTLHDDNLSPGENYQEAK